MKTITGLTDQPNQQSFIVLDDGTRASLLLSFRQNLGGWFYDLTYGDFVLAGQYLPTHPNFLRQWQEIIPFGLACITDTFLDPNAVDQFLTGSAKLVLLDAADVALVEETVFEGF